MKTLALSFLLVLTALLFGCGYAKHIDPPVYVYADAKVAEFSAKAHAKENPAVLTVHQNVCCGSMRPTIQQGDWLVVENSKFGDHLLGKCAVYKPAWNNNQPVLHRLVSGNAQDGFIASGDNNPKSEASERVTSANYVGEVVAIYRTENIN